MFGLCVCSRIDGVMRTMSIEKLIKTLPIIQNQLDALLDFQVTWCVCACGGGVCVYSMECVHFPMVDMGVRFEMKNKSTLGGECLSSTLSPGQPQ